MRETPPLTFFPHRFLSSSINVHRKMAAASYSWGGNMPTNSNSLISIVGYTSLWVGAFDKGARALAREP